MPIARQIAIAAIVGTMGGGIAGMWSVAQKPAIATTIQTASKPVVTKSSPAGPAQTAASTPVLSHDATAVAPAGLSDAAKVNATVAAAAKASASVPAPTLPAGSNGGDVLLRARALAQRPDVKALVALRESVAKRAAGGETEAAATKQQLDVLDRYLEQARLLRLKLDAEEFKHADAAANRPR